MYHDGFWKQHRTLLRLGLHWGLAIGLVWCTALLLRALGFGASIDNDITTLGFDTERMLLLDYLIMTFLSSFGAAFFVQRRASPWIGGLTYFLIRYLLPFAQQAQHPGLGADGQQQILLPMALFGILLTMCLLAFLLAAMGAVLGQAWGHLLMTPVITLLSLLKGWDTPIQEARLHALRNVIGSLILGIILLSALIGGTKGAGMLLMYGPTTNLYQSTGNSSSLPHGTVQQGTFPSPTLGGIQRTYWIYLPPSYTTATTQHYPTLYLLHGSPGSPADWFVAGHAATSADVLIAEKKLRETILVSADGNGPVYRFSEWANSFDGRQRMEDAIVHDLVSWIDSHYRTLAQPQERAIGGLSMGGYGAMNIALHHPEVFRKVISLGGYFEASSPVFGSGTASNAYRQQNSPTFLLHTVQGKRILAQDVVVIGVGTTDKHYFQEGMAFYRALLSMKLPVRLLTNTGGHAWSLWTRQLQEALPILEGAISASRADASS